MSERVRIKNVEVLAEGFSVLKRTSYDFRRTDGSWQAQVRETYDRGDGIAVLLYDPDRETIILIRQFRFPAFYHGEAGELVEVPAGTLDDPTPEDGIRREIEEETGYRIQNVTRVFEAYMSPGSVTEKLYMFTARYSPADRVGGGGGLHHEGEDIEILEVPFTEAMAMLKRGDIHDAKTIMLLQHAALNIFGGK
ncbi:MAG: NUDIX domain-containing protein [Afipia sp.]|nr:NUDIX domain-containing protein [Afipia sp.]